MDLLFKSLIELCFLSKGALLCNSMEISSTNGLPSQLEWAQHLGMETVLHFSFASLPWHSKCRVLCSAQSSHLCGDGGGAGWTALEVPELMSAPWSGLSMVRR